MTVAELHAQLDSTPLPDVAVIDLSMPGALGPDHIAAVLRRYPDMPVVVLSGAEDAAQMKMLLDLGVRGYIPKAYSRSEEHTSELQSLMRLSYAVFCFKKK